jgi:DNA excision repair protein ERCC-8
MFFSASFDKNVRVWDPNTEKSPHSFRLTEKVYSISTSKCATKHNLIATATGHHLFRMCDLKSGSSVQNFAGHKSSILACKWSPGDEYMVASASEDLTVRLWDIRRSGCLYIFDQFKTRLKKETSRDPTSHHEAINSLLWSQDGRYLYSSGKDQKVNKWDVHTQENILTTFPDIKNTHLKNIQMALSNDGTVLYHPNDQEIGMYNTDNGMKIKTLSGHYGAVNSLSYHPKLEELYSTANDYQVLIWSPKRVVSGSDLQDKDDWSD